MRRWWWRVLARELGGHLGRVVFFISCLAIGVGAVVAVGAARRTVDQGIRSQARTLLAGDLAISSRQPLPNKLGPILSRIPHLRRSDLVELATVAAAPYRGAKPGPSQLVELKAIDDKYPLYGALDLNPGRAAGARLDADSCIVAPDLLVRLGLHLDDHLEIGGKRFRIVASIRGEPDRLGALFSLGPRVFISRPGLARTDLLAFGSRVEYQTMLALPESAPPAEIETLAAHLRHELGDSRRIRVHTYRNAQPAVGSAIDRVTRFLGLVALLTLLVSSIGVAQTIRAWLAERLDAIALLRCLGVRPRATL
ncbi:MAG TPA: ABC transporter permease, partial [Thermoanaerobaculia bacterium]|nr:ABC transporter permease [Thermoanaerobaculia bacterium]